MIGPCPNGANVVQVLTAVFAELSSLLTIWLAHRRKKADRERRKFYWQMRQKHGIQRSGEEQKRAERGDFL